MKIIRKRFHNIEKIIQKKEYYMIKNIMKTTKKVYQKKIKNINKTKEKQIIFIE